MRLEELVKKKTVSNNKLNELKSEKVTETNLQLLINELCTICIEGYTVGNTRKFLPCGHIFHDSCIDSWLSQKSTKCPLDRLSID